MNKRLKILFVEDHEDDALILVLHLEREKFSVKWTRVDSLEDFEEKLKAEPWDLVISDYSLPGFSGDEVLSTFKKLDIDIPFILVSGAIGDEKAAELMSKGAQDFILKGKLQRLVPAIERETYEMVVRNNNRFFTEQLRKAKIIIDSSHVVLWELNIIPENQIVFCSDNVEQYGYLTEQYDTYMDLFKVLIHPDDYQNLFAEIRKGIFRRLTTFDCEYRIVCKDNSVRWINTTFKVFNDNADKRVWLQGINVDTTERKAYETRIIEAKEKAEESDRFKSVLMANMSHELRTPMNGILGFAQILRQSAADRESAEMTNMIISSAKRLQMTLDSIMTIAQLDAGTELKDTAINSINVSTMLDLLSSYYIDQCIPDEIQFNQSIEPDIHVKAEPKLLRTAFSNVLDNSFKFTKRGMINISLAKEIVSAAKFAVIKISDTGIGIQPHNLELIFQDFRQISEGMNRSHEGLGLGLSITNRIVKLFGGTITAASEINNGTEIVIKLPLHEEMLSQQVPETPVEPSDPGAIADSSNLPWILSVEDNHVNQKLIESYLVGICNIDCAMNANEAFKKVTRKQYMAILMDINLGPSMDGLEAAKKIKQLENYASVPIIAVTGYAMVGDKERMIEEGCDYYIGKPFDQETLVCLIESIVK